MISPLCSVYGKAFTGLDWLDNKHEVCVQDGLTAKYEVAVAALGTIRHRLFTPGPVYLSGWYFAAVCRFFIQGRAYAV